MTKLRISIVEYLNTAPLVWGFTDGPLAGRYDLSFTVPSKCAEALRKGDVDVDALTRHSNMSAKTLERHFAEKIGLNPKFFSRIVRFSHAMKMVEGQKNIFEIIDSCGYSDQAHLIREFKHFTGRTPVYGYVGLEEMPRLFLDNLGLDVSA